MVAALVVCACVGGLAFLAVAGSSADRAPVVVAGNLRDQGDRVRVPSDISRPTVVAFFASWCRQCDAQLRNLERFHERVGGQVQFVGVNFSDQRGRALAALTEAGVTFPVISDRRGTVAEKFRVAGVPSTVFVDAAGRVVERTHGYNWRLEEDLRRYLGVSVPASEG